MWAALKREENAPWTQKLWKLPMSTTTGVTAAEFQGNRKRYDLI